MTFAGKEWIFPILGQIIVLAAVLGIVWFVQQNPIQNVEPLVNVVLTATSVLFGFLTLSMTMHLEELREQKQHISDLAAELLKLLDKVRNDPKLSQKTIHFSTKYYKYGFEGFGASATAESIILEAYDYLLKNFRDVVHSCRLLVFAWAIPGLAFLILSIIVGVLSKIMVMEPDFVATIGLMSIVFGVAITILGWWDSNRKLERHCDSLFNIRHTILGDLYREDSYVGYMRDG